MARIIYVVPAVAFIIFVVANKECQLEFWRQDTRSIAKACSYGMEIEGGELNDIIDMWKQREHISPSMSEQNNIFNWDNCLVHEHTAKSQNPLLLCD